MSRWKEQIPCHSFQLTIENRKKKRNEWKRRIKRAHRRYRSVLSGSSLAPRFSAPGEDDSRTAVWRVNRPRQQMNSGGNLDVSIHDSFARLIKERPSLCVAGIHHNKNFVEQPSVIVFTPLLRIRVCIVSVHLISDRFSAFLESVNIGNSKATNPLLFTIAFIKLNFIAE